MDTKYEKKVRKILEQLQKYYVYANLKRYRFDINEINFLRCIKFFLKVYIKLKCIKNINN